jgi:hypothetical protein
MPPDFPSVNATPPTSHRPPAEWTRPLIASTSTANSRPAAAAGPGSSQAATHLRLARTNEAAGSGSRSSAANSDMVRIHSAWASEASFARALETTNSVANRTASASSSAGASGAAAKANENSR